MIAVCRLSVSMPASCRHIKQSLSCLLHRLSCSAAVLTDWQADSPIGLVQVLAMATVRPLQANSLARRSGEGPWNRAGGRSVLLNMALGAGACTAAMFELYYVSVSVCLAELVRMHTLCGQAASATRTDARLAIDWSISLIVEACVDRCWLVGPRSPLYIGRLTRRKVGRTAAGGHTFAQVCGE